MSEYHWSNLCKDIIYTKVFKVNQIHYKFFLQNRKTVCICIAFGLKIMKGVSVSANVSLIKNLKKMLFGLLKDEDFALKKTLARVSPVLLL